VLPTILQTWLRVELSSNPTQTQLNLNLRVDGIVLGQQWITGFEEKWRRGSVTATSFIAFAAEAGAGIAASFNGEKSDRTICDLIMCLSKNSPKMLQQHLAFQNNCRNV